MKTTTIKKIKKWVKDFNKTQPNNVMITDDRTFEEDAYLLFQEILFQEK